MSTIPSQSHIVSVDISTESNLENQHEVDHELPNFSITQERLSELVQINDGVSLEQNGAGLILQIAAALESNINTGIVGDKTDIGRRQRAFGFSSCQFEEQDNNNPTRKIIIFNELILKAFKDSTIILLLCCAMLSLLIGIKANGPQEGLLDGAMVFLTIILVLNFSLMSRFVKTRLMMLRKLKKHNNNKRAVSVIRCGEMQEIPVSDIVVGDVVFLEAGNLVPADGLLIEISDSFKLDDERGGINYASMFSGAKVVEGNCRMIVTAIGKSTEMSKLIETVLRNRDLEEPKLQAAIDKMSCRLENLWLILSLFILSVQVLRCFMQKSAADNSKCHNPDPKGSLKNMVEDIMNASTRIMRKKGGGGKVNNGLVSLLSILILATRDGLPLGILVLCFCSSRKMKSLFGATVQKLSSCVTIGLVTSICLGKTNDLILRQSKMADLWIGLERVMDVSKEVNRQILEIFREGIVVTFSGQQQVINDSLLFWSEKMLGVVMDNEGYRNSSTTILYNEPLSNGNCCMSILTRGEEEENPVQMLYLKGDPDFILSLCSHYYDLEGTMQMLDEEKRQMFTKLIEDIESNNSLACFAFAHKKIIQKSRKLEEQDQEDNVHGADEETFNSMYHGFSLVALVHLKTPYPPEVMEALSDFRAMGINVKLVVDDDANMARIMALNCGILRPAGENEESAIMEASHFLKEARMDMIGNVPNVIANASPNDKLLIVQGLRKKDEVVAMTSSIKRDSPSLLEADVGIFLDNNIHNGVVVEEEEADIIVGQKIGTIVSMLRTGRYLCKQIEIFLILHLTLNLSAFALNFILEVLRNEAQLSSFHLLWTNLIVETLGAFALSMWEGPPGVLSKRIPPHNGPIITKMMWRNIATQCLFQVTILLVLTMKGKDIFHVDENVLCTMIFNCYVLCQVFALIGTIRMTSSSCGGAIWENYLFFIVVVILAMQVMLVEIMWFLFHWGKLDYKKWFICIGIAAVSVPVGYVSEWVFHVILLAI